MYFKLVSCFCFIIFFISARSQRVWGPSGYNTGFSNSWKPNGFSNQNLGSWNPSVFGNNQFNAAFGSNTDKGPTEQQSSYGSLNDDKPSRNSVRPGISNSGSSGNGFNVLKSNKEKLESLINVPNTNTNTFSSSNNDNLSSWGQVFGSSNQNLKTNERNPNNNADTSQSNFFSSASNYNNFSSFGSSTQNSKPNQKPNSNSFSSESNEFFSNWAPSKPSGANENLYSIKNNKKPTGNDISVGSDHKENSVYSWIANNKEKNKPNKNIWKATTSKPTQNTNKPLGSNNWNQNGNTQEESQDNMKTVVDTAILDELDKNDWYFGKESNYPKPPFKSLLNINVSELWDFDKNRRLNQNSKERKNKDSNNRRRNRQTKEGKDGIQCECVSVALCDEEDMILTWEDIAYDRRPLEAFRCQRSSEVCCTNPKLKFSSRTNIEEKSLYCGQRRIQKSSAEVIMDDFVEPGEFPWILEFQSSETNCSASLIHPQLALTAAHCVTNVEDHVYLKAGVWNFGKEPPQIQKVTKIIPHPAYSSQNPRNDIALLLLEKGFQLNDNVNTICLPFSNNRWNIDECVVAGWGLKEVNGETVQILDKRVVEFIPQSECQNIMLITDLWRNYILHDSFVCAREKAGNNNGCLKNEGGPVMCPNQKEPDTYLQIGIVSNGLNCDNFGRPGIFTNVLKFLDWINKNHFDLGLSYDLDIRNL